MVGLERSTLPLVGRDDFHLASSAAVLSFIVAFGLVKALTNLAAGTLAQRVGRRRLSKEIEQLGATVKAQWATLGHFDFVNVVEAPDETTMARVSLELGSRGTAKYETLSAIPIDDFISAL